MQLREACRLRELWGNKACEHPQEEREYYLGAHMGDEVCVRCGRVVTRDKNGQPIPSRPGAA